MMHLARSQGMDVITDATEADARIALRAADTASVIGDALVSTIAPFDYTLKRQRAAANAQFGQPIQRE